MKMLRGRQEERSRFPLQNQNKKSVLGFIIVGTAASGVNWLARIALSFFISYTQSVIIAYLIGMVFSFHFYRTRVFTGSKSALHIQVTAFVGVNIIGLLVVFCAANIFLEAANHFGNVPLVIQEAISHLFAIATGAVVTFFGHNLISFKRK